MVFTPSLRLLAVSLVALLDPVSAIWPAPQSFTKGNSSLYLHQNLKITYNGEPVRLSTSSSSFSFPHPPNNVCGPVGPGYEGLFTKTPAQQQLAYTADYPASSLSSKEIVTAGVSRALGSIFSKNFVPWMLQPRGKLSQFEPDVYKGQKWIKSLEIVQTTKDANTTIKPALAGEVSEEYNLTLSAEGDAKLTADSYIGVLHGLETFTQLFFQHSTGTSWYTPYAPVEIKDKPKFPHRGILLDVARTFMPVKNILRTIDGMAASKLNRLHVHVTDSQSWPLQIISMPEVAEKGAYHPTQTYSPADIENIQKYGALRGVQVYFEIDMPGHIGSVSLSHPDIIVAYNEWPYQWYCAEPPCGAFKLNDTKVDDFLGKLWDDLLPRVTPYSAYFHTGGDELNRNDSMLDEGIKSNDTEVLRPLLQKFVDKQHERIRKQGLTPLTWEEIPLEWNVDVGKDVVVQTWLGPDSVKNLTSKGHKVIDSNYNFWYLDCGRGQWLNFDNAAYAAFSPFLDWCNPYKGWRHVYSHDPVANLTEEEAKLVLGGEVAVWAESIDPITLDTIIWPRASVAGEVLWSGRIDPATGQNRTQLDAAPRLSELRERLVARGVQSSSVYMTWCTQDPTGKSCEYPLV
ncbi:glycoside hydrolase superfamily [Pseudoneurospora amorphoporcata]|uniref:Beta-hexosaminidase n=1 Tax=Pseudoneurospora amorphoporcata TaxID=241081 RepID=A0AAN6SGU2_9PEZI|nr:glycoside hydrolase superfamily [Pseudoneurospora amorphoporcata]